MSAFIVQDKTINNIVSHIVAKMYKGNYDHAFRIHLAPIGISTMKDLAQRKQLALEMFKLNVYAVNGRYNEINSWEDFEFKHEDVSRCQVLESIQCWKYQCSEGDAMEKPIFKFIEEVEHCLMRSIIEEMPEYNKANWD